MLNKVELIGRIGQDIELKSTKNGEAVINLSIATNDGYTDKNGEKVDRVEWHRVVVFGRMAENCNKYLVKGSLVYIEGRLTTHKWEDERGENRYTTLIKTYRMRFLDRKRTEKDSAKAPDHMNDLGPPFPSVPSESYESSMDDVPF